MLGTHTVNTARMRGDSTSVIGRYDILPIAAFKTIRIQANNSSRKNPAC